MTSPVFVLSGHVLLKAAVSAAPAPAERAEVAGEVGHVLALHAGVSAGKKMKNRNFKSYSLLKLAKFLAYFLQNIHPCLHVTDETRLDQSELSVINVISQ